LISGYNLGYYLQMARFVIEFNLNVKKDLEWIQKNHHSSIKTSIAEQLQFTPHVETRNRKPLNPQIREAEWELRCGDNNRYRVLYRFWFVELPEESDTVGVVLVVAIGEKKGERLWIGGEKQ
jgi:hypothetical protein